MVIAPEVHHNAVCQLQGQHNQVQAQNYKNHDRGQGICPGSGGTSGPTDIHDVRVETKIRHHGLNTRAHLSQKRIDYKVYAAKAHAGRNAAFQQRTDFYPQADADDEHDNRHHAHGAQTRNPIQRVDNNLHFVSLL